MDGIFWFNDRLNWSESLLVLLPNLWLELDWEISTDWTRVGCWAYVLSVYVEVIGFGWGWDTIRSFFVFRFFRQMMMMMMITTVNAIHPMIMPAIAAVVRVFAHSV